MYVCFINLFSVLVIIFGNFLKISFLLFSMMMSPRVSSCFSKSFISIFFEGSFFLLLK